MPYFYGYCAVSNESVILNVILASASPRRYALLSMLLPNFTCQAADIDEAPRAAEAPADYVCRMAEEKAAKVWVSGSVVLGADTTVVHQNRILHKPSSFADAEGMLLIKWSNP